MEKENSCSYIQPIPCRNREVYTELNSLVYEYLEVNGLEQALRAFSKECTLKNLPCPKTEGGNELKAAFTHYDGQKLLKSFDEGDLESFLKIWKQFQTRIQVTSEDMKKLEVYLRVHFAIWPKAKDLPESKQLQAMQQLKTFFEEHSESLSSDATILPLFALPFVSDPRPHPIFKDLFQENWTIKLRAQLETTVNKYFELLQENITTHCKLAAAVAKSKSKLQQSQVYSLPCDVGREATPKKLSLTNSSRSLSSSGSSQPQPTVKQCSDRETSTSANIETKLTTAYHQDRFFQLLSIHKKLRKVLRGVRENYAKLLKVCSILLNSVEKPDELPLDKVIHQSYLIYPDIFTSPSNPSSSFVISANSKPDIDHFKKLCAAATTTTFTTDVSDVGLLFLGVTDIGLATLDYEKIKTDLASEALPATEKLCLLQALRWLITKTSPSARTQVMTFFTQNDILALEMVSTEVHEKLLAPLLSQTPTYQKESLARFVNALASTWTGRNYLTGSDFVVENLIQSLATFKTQEESFICHMVIAALQKLSLRKSMRVMMIEKDVIPWLVKYIKTELDRDIVREEVSQVLLEEAETLNNNNNDVNYGDSTFNNYLMEYAWALLMNLCLHPESIQSALTVDFEFLHCIVTMLTNKSSSTSNEFIPYVLSTLFSLLRNPELFDKVKTMNLDQKLSAVIEHQPPDIAKHMKHLLSQLYEKEDVDRLMALGETDYDDTDNPDPDELETELELQESWMTPKNEGSLLTGDDLLIKCYLIQQDTLPPPPPLEKFESNNERNDNSNDTDASNSTDSPPESDNVGLLLRPKTPTHGRTSHALAWNDSLQNESGELSASMHPHPVSPTKKLENVLTEAGENVKSSIQEQSSLKNYQYDGSSHLHHQESAEVLNNLVQMVTTAESEETTGLLPIQPSCLLFFSPLQKNLKTVLTPQVTSSPTAQSQQPQAKCLLPDNYPNLHESPLISFNEKTTPKNSTFCEGSTLISSPNDEDHFNISLI